MSTRHPTAKTSWCSEVAAEQLHPVRSILMTRSGTAASRSCSGPRRARVERPRIQLRRGAGRRSDGDNDLGARVLLLKVPNSICGVLERVCALDHRYEDPVVGEQRYPLKAFPARRGSDDTYAVGQERCGQPAT